MELGRIIMLYNGAHHSPIKLRWFTQSFVAGDVQSFVMQALGAQDVNSSNRFAYLIWKLLYAPESRPARPSLITGGPFVQVIAMRLGTLSNDGQS